MINKNILITTLILILSILIFEFSQIDLTIQTMFYNFDTKHWLIDKNEPIFKEIFYDDIKILLILFNIFILISIFVFRESQIIKRFKHGLILVLLSFIFVPSIISGLKVITNIPCPKNIKIFNGTYPYVKIFDSYPKEFICDKKIKCFPAGHASGGFALMSLYFLFTNQRNKNLALIFAISLGFTMGIYKMLIGDHFLSHTIVTMILSWLIILIIYQSYFRILNAKPTKI